MTVAASIRKSGPYTGNGTNTTFPFYFKVFTKNDIQPVLTDANGAAVSLVLDSDFSVLLNADQDANPGGSVTYPAQVGPAPMPAGSTLTVIGGMPFDQATDITNGGRFLPQVYENALDKLTMLMQQLREVTSRSLQAAIGTTVSLIFPAPSSGKFIRWRSDLLGLENVDAGTDSIALQGLLADGGDVTHGAAMIGFKLDATGSVAQTLASRLSQQVSVKDFGAVGDGVTNDTAALQAAINWAGPRGRALFFPRGDYLYSGVTLSAGWAVQFIGENTAGTSLSLSSGTATGFSCATELPVVFENLTFQYKAGVVGTAGAFISLLGGATMNANSRFRNLQMNAPWIGINAPGAYAWVADTVFMGNFLNYAFLVGNSFVGDAGDSTIKNSVLTTNSSTENSIFHVSSGGLRLINNKHIGGFAFYQLSLAAGVNTSDLLVTGNSIEGTASSGLLANRQAGTGTFSNIVITGNQFAGIAFPVNFNNGATGWLSKIAITGNVVLVSGSNGVGVNISTANAFHISGNQFTATDATSKAVVVAATATDGQIGQNEYSGFTTALTSSSPSTSVAKISYQAVINGLACSSTFGALYSGTTNISFPVGLFKTTPLITAAISGGTNGVSAMTANATASGFTLYATAATSGATVQVTYRAEADY